MHLEPILADLNRDGFASAEQHPQITQKPVQVTLGERAEQIGLRFVYDPVTKTGALVREGTHDYTLKQQATLLISWMHLVFRYKTARTVEQEGQWQSLTPEAQRQNAISDLYIRPEYLSQRFQNLYTTPDVARRALNDLDARNLLRKSSNGEGDRYYATPLLAHVVAEDAALELIQAHLRGEFEEYFPEEPAEGDVEEQVLHLIRGLPHYEATSGLMAERLGITKKEIDPILKRLRSEGAITHLLGKKRGGYWAMQDEGGEEE